MLRFVTADSSSLGQKRKQSQRACEQCRKRKKRCDHSDARPTSTALRQPSPKQDGLIGTSITTEGSKPSTSGLIHFSKESEGFDAPPNFKQNATSPVQVSSTTDSNFSGQDAASIAGQALFDGRGESQSAFRNSEALGSRFIGDLNPEGIFLAATSPTSTTTANRHDSIGIWLVDKLSGTVQSCSGSLAEHAESHSFYGYSPLVQKVLLPLLIEECLSIVPPQTEFQVLYNIYLEKSHPIFPVLDKAAFESMNHTQPASILLKQGICLAASMNVDARNHLWLPSISSALSHREFGMRLSTAMRTSIGIGLVTEKIVLIQASILLSFFIEGPDGGDLSSQFCGNAVQLVQSIGLHVQNRRHDSKDQYAETLLCCVWARDRLNAAFHGRPVLMHLQDFAKDLESCFRRQDTCFQVFLRVIMLLDAVINLYRPASDRNALGWEGDFPSFEELLASSGGSHIPTPLLATIEIMYHAVAILSCRSRSFEEPQRSSTSYIRQTLSAAQIGSIVDQEFRDQLSFFPFVPYAVSLSLSVAYREMRHSKISMYRARARLKLQNICNILQSLSDIFWSASTLGDMGQATIREMDRVYSTVANSQHRENQQHTAPETLSAEHGGSADDRPPSPRNVNLRRNSEPEPDSSALNGDFYEQKDVNPSLLTADMQDFDVFELFDPNFDLDEIDACLGGNLDLSFHTNFQ